MRYLIATAFLLALASSVLARNPGAPARRQPEVTQGEIDRDRRLGQTVELDILGRSVAFTLGILSKHTSVLFGVAPQDASTVGERKITILARGLTLREIMLFLPEALQECHWEVESSASRPVYVLRRNPGVEGIPERDRRRTEVIRQRVLRDRRVGRIAEAKRALELSPTQLRELEKSDLFLARALLDADTRPLMEAFCALPPQRIRDLLSGQQLEIRIGELPAAAQEVIRSRGGARLWPLRGVNDHSEVILRPEFPVTIGAGDDGGVWISLFGPTAFLVIPPKYPYYGTLVEKLLQRTGTPADQARATIGEWEKKHWEVDTRERRARRERGWSEPSNPRLHHPVRLGSSTWRLSDFQQNIADEVGFSIVSDYFTYDSLSLSARGELRQEQPLWRALYILSQPDDYVTWDDHGPFEWRSVGNCLVFHRTRWYEHAARELPESFILSWREKLQKQGRFTLNDVGEAATILMSRTAGYDLPSDLSNAGIPGPEVARFVLLYATLSPQQKALAASPGGLPYEEMTADQKERARAMLVAWGKDTTTGGILRVKESAGIENGKPFARLEFSLTAPGETRYEGGWRLTLPEVGSPS